MGYNPYALMAQYYASQPKSQPVQSRMNINPSTLNNQSIPVQQKVGQLGVTQPKPQPKVTAPVTPALNLNTKFNPMDSSTHDLGAGKAPNRGIFDRAVQENLWGQTISGNGSDSGPINNFDFSALPNNGMTKTGLRVDEVIPIRNQKDYKELANNKAIVYDPEYGWITPRSNAKGDKFNQLTEGAFSTALNLGVGGMFAGGLGALSGGMGLGANAAKYAGKLGSGALGQFWKGS